LQLLVLEEAVVDVLLLLLLWVSLKLEEVQALSQELAEQLLGVDQQYLAMLDRSEAACEALVWIQGHHLNQLKDHWDEVLQVEVEAGDHHLDAEA